MSAPDRQHWLSSLGQVSWVHISALISPPPTSTNIHGGDAGRERCPGFLGLVAAERWKPGPGWCEGLSRTRRHDTTPTKDRRENLPPGALLGTERDTLSGGRRVPWHPFSGLRLCGFRWPRWTRQDCPVMSWDDLPARVTASGATPRGFSR